MAGCWDRALSEKTVSSAVVLIIFAVLTWFNASDFDWELQGEGGTVTMALLATIGHILWQCRNSNSVDQKQAERDRKEKERLEKEVAVLRELNLTLSQQMQERLTEP